MNERQIEHEENNGAIGGTERLLEDTSTHSTKQSEYLANEVPEHTTPAQQSGRARTIKSLLAGVIALVIVGAGIVMVMQPSPEEVALEQQQREIIEKMVTQLPEDQRDEFREYMEAVSEFQERNYIQPAIGALEIDSQNIESKRFVMVKSVTLPAPGFVVISGIPEGVSNLLPKGTTNDFLIVFEEDVRIGDHVAFAYIDDGDGVFNSELDQRAKSPEGGAVIAGFNVSHMVEDIFSVFEEYIGTQHKQGDCTLAVSSSAVGYDQMFGGGDPAQGGTTVSTRDGRDAFMVFVKTAYIGLNKTLFVRQGESGFVMFRLSCVGPDTEEAERAFDEVVQGLR